MSAMTDALELLAGNHLFRSATWAKPAGLYLGLITLATDAETGSVTEVSGGGYARVAAGPSDTVWGLPAGDNRFSNLAALSFPAPTGDWGAVSLLGLWDAATAGQLLATAPLAEVRTISNGDPAPNFAIGTIGFTFVGSLSAYLAGLMGAHLFRSATWSKPATLYFALRSGSVEVSGGSYARVARASADANWTAPTGGDGLFRNASNIVWATPTADWGAVDVVAVYDAAIDGNELLASALSAEVTILNGSDAPNFTPSALGYALA